jgi:NADH-quinone oxidoreductase subunit N
MEKLNLLAALPEILLLLAALLLVVLDAVSTSAKKFGLHRLALLALVPSVWVVLANLDAPVDYAFNGMYVTDALGSLLKVCALIAVAASLVYAHGYAKDREMDRGEFYSLALFALLGQMVMISAANLLVVYLGLELMSLSLYALAALRRDAAGASEAAIKYFVLGALASGFILYGMSMIYGGSGSLDLAQIADHFAAGRINLTIFVFGVVFVVAGLAFKFGAVPFHMWVPDVYQGTPTAVTLLIGGAPKLATFAIAFRLLVEGMGGVTVHWQQMLVVLAVLSLVLGNLVGIAQTNLKRMLAYSSIAQIGFVLLGMASGVVEGDADLAADAYGGALFYIITYVLTTVGGFGLIQLLARRGFECEEIADLRGLNARSPWMAFVMLILMFSLAGLPPTVGFYAKLSVLSSAVAAGQLWLAVLAVMASLVGAFYYLRVVKVMYFDSPVDDARLQPPAGARMLLGVNGGLILVLGLLPGPLMGACLAAVRQALGG